MRFKVCSSSHWTYLCKAFWFAKCLEFTFCSSVQFAALVERSEALAVRFGMFTWGISWTLESSFVTQFCLWELDTFCFPHVGTFEVSFVTGS